MRKILVKEGKKWCPHCNDWLNIDDFYFKKKSPGDRDAYCKKHRNEYDKKYNKQAYRRKHRYGMTFYQYDLLYQFQNGKCAICGRKENKKRLAVDHCHKSGKIRGLLCSGCNILLGRFYDDPKIFELAIQYLKQSTNGNPYYYEHVAHQEAPKRLPVHNKSGFIGVSWRPERNRWRACRRIDKKNKHIGYFKTKEDAVAAYNNHVINNQKMTK